MDNEDGNNMLGVCKNFNIGWIVNNLIFKGYSET